MHISAQKRTHAAATGSYVISEIKGSVGFEALRSEWDMLWRLSPQATETQSWHWQYLYWKHLAPDTVPVFVTARDTDGRCVALAAFFQCRDPLSYLSKVAFIGDKRPDYNAILEEPGLPESVGTRLLERCAGMFKSKAHYFELANVPERSYTGRVLERFLADARAGESLVSRWKTETYAVILPATVDEYLSALGPRSRRDFKYDRRRLSEEMSVDFRVYAGMELLDEALDAIETIDRARWGTNSRYCVAAQRRFERDVAHALCSMGLYRAFVLYLDGKPRAFVSGCVVHNSLKVGSIGFDRFLPGRWSVGKIANFYAIEYCINNGIEEYDLTRGGEQYKKWFGATPSSNLHVRWYRSKVDRLAEAGAQRVVSFLRQQDQLRSLYQRVIRR